MAVGKVQGLVTSQNIMAHRDVPGFDNSAMDGWAINTSDLDQGRPTEQQPLTIADVSLAGHGYQGKIPPGGCVKITTGARIPENCDAVIRVEDSRSEGDKVYLDDFPRRDNIRRFDNDIKKNETLIVAGKKITIIDIANLYTQGISEIDVYPKPHVAFFTTGDEIVERNAGGDSVINSNRIYLEGRLARWGVGAEYLCNARDDEKELSETIERAEKSGAGLIISTGGVSMGEKDLVKARLENAGWEIVFWKAQIKPGKPMLFARKKEQLFIGLPGNPVSVVMLTEMIVRPIVDRLAGVPAESCPKKFFKGRLKNSCNLKPPRTIFLMGRAVYENDEYALEVFSQQSSQSLSLLSRGNAIIMWRPEDGDLEPNQLARFIPLL
jgi:molybdopterin molybdotransferase